LSAPGVGNTGAITVDVDLTAHPWLRFDWDADGMNDDDPPQASGVFGRYRGHDRIIYWSEQR
jgi:MSHA biogenesis protein MshQ